MRTFEKWPRDYGVATPERLSIAGLICLSAEENNLTVKCVYCNKTLECWQDTDLPIKEHYLHMIKCPLFNVNQIKDRMATFKGWGANEARLLARNGFVKYNLRSRDFIFCYKCGSTDRSHTCKRAPGSVYSIEKHSKIFFYNLIEGAYNEQISEVFKTSVYIPKQMKQQVRLLTEQSPGDLSLRSVEEAIKGYVHRQLVSIERLLDEDIQKILSEVFNDAPNSYLKHCSRIAVYDTKLYTL